MPNMFAICPLYSKCTLQNLPFGIQPIIQCKTLAVTPLNIERIASRRAEKQTQCGFKPWGSKRLDPNVFAMKVCLSPFPFPGIED